MVELATHHDVSPPLTLLPPAPRSSELIEHEVKRLPRRVGPARLQADPVHQSSAASLLMPATLTNFDGIGQGFGGFMVNSAPPDTNGDVGPDRFVQSVNSDFAVLSKTGALLYGPVAINTLWSGFGGGCQNNNDGDPIVKYDKVADRWIITQFSVTNANGSSVPFLQCVAVSTTNDPTGSYSRYSFPYNGFNDYPKLSVWPDAYYVTFNVFNAAGTSFLGGKVCAYDRSSMLTGAAATQQCFDESPAGACPNAANCYGGTLPSDVDGATQPPAGSPNYVLGLGATTSTLALWKFHVDWTTPGNSSLTGPIEFGVAAYTTACGSTGTCIPQSGTSQQLDSLSDRLMFRLAYRNFGDHESLVVNHSVTVGSGQTGVRWYEIRSPGATPSVFQQGTYAPDANHRWMGSIAMDRSGNMGLGFSLSGSGLHPQIHYTGRLVGDAAGTMSQGESTIIDGGGSQGTTLKRWGDYSHMSVDPIDDCTFWYTSEYLATSGTFNWNTRIGSFKFPGCGGTVTNDFSISSNPGSLSLRQNTSGTSTISTAVTAGSAGTVNLAVSGVPGGASASLAPTSVTAGNGSTLTVNAGTAAPGNYTITVTGTEGTVTHATTVALVVSTTPPNDFSISANPTSLSIVQGGSGTSTIATAVISGSAGTVSLTASVSPAGPTASLSPTSVAAGNSSTLTVSAGSSATGSYTVTVTGTEGSMTHSTSVAVTVTAPVGGGGITNGGFENGTFTGWTTAGTTAVVSGGAHSGTYSARVGGTTPTNGDSTIAQTFNAPAGATTLSFWYAVHCPDTLTYDWATATLKDNAANTTTTVLTKTCNNAGTWTQVSTAVTQGKSYTLTLISHDDNYTGDPTYTMFDDVSIAVSTPTNDFSISANPTSLSLLQNASGTSTISTAVTSGTVGTVTLTASVSPAGPTATLNPTSVSAGGSSTLTVNSGSSAPGSYTVTVTGSGAGKTHTATVTVTVTVPDFSISASPNSMSLVRNTSGTSTISTAAINGPGTVSLSVSGTPSGASAAVSPTSVTATGSSTLTVNSGTAAAGNYTITVTGVEGSVTHATTVALTVTVPVTGGITNGGFETGNFSGWTTAGPATSVSTTSHSGTYAGQAGGTSPTSGDSTITQTFTAPTGTSTISVWYATNCPDTLTYDWAQITLTDNTTATSTDLLAPVCDPSGVWTNVTGAVTPGHSYTLRLLNHDDNYPGDPTYTRFDDITLR